MAGLMLAWFCGACSYVTLNREGVIESDGYAFNDVCGERLQGKDSKTARSLQGVGGDGRLPSGAAGAGGPEGGDGGAGVGWGGGAVWA